MTCLICTGFVRLDAKQLRKGKLKETRIVLLLMKSMINPEKSKDQGQRT